VEVGAEEITDMLTLEVERAHCGEDEAIVLVSMYIPALVFVYLVCRENEQRVPTARRILTAFNCDLLKYYKAFKIKRQRAREACPGAKCGDCGKALVMHS
jgi:hypothetical protein